MYKAFPPPALLAPYIDAFWVVTGTEGPGRRILPDMCADLIFYIGEDEKQFSAFAVGTMTTWAESGIAGSLLGIRFKPGGMMAFTRVPMSLLTDKRVAAGDLSLPLLKHLQEALKPCTCIREMLQSLSACLLRMLPDLADKQRRIIAAIEVIRIARGNLSPVVLAAEVNMSPRNFERQFLAQIGTSPKTFSRIVRCLNAKSSLHRQPAVNLLSLALDHGYHDHAHFTKEFSHIIGQSPQEYLSFIYKQ